MRADDEIEVWSVRIHTRLTGDARSVERRNAFREVLAHQRYLGLVYMPVDCLWSAERLPERESNLGAASRSLMRRESIESLTAIRHAHVNGKAIREKWPDPPDRIKPEHHHPRDLQGKVQLCECAEGQRPRGDDQAPCLVHILRGGHQDM